MHKSLNMLLVTLLVVAQCIYGQDASTHLRNKDFNFNRPTMDTQCPCNVTVSYNTISVDCSGRSLTSLLSSWFPENTTDLMLQNNKLTRIRNDTFQNVHQLERLSLQLNVLSVIEPNAFQHLENLHYLNLEYNKLDLFRLPTDTFRYLINLRELRLNQMHTELIRLKTFAMRNASFPDGMFGSLTNLTILSVSALHNRVLYFNKEFRNLTNLIELRVSGTSDIIETYSFENVVSVQNLYLLNFSLVSNFSDSALGSFEELKHVIYDRAHMGLHVALNTLRPLVNTNITFLRISHTHLTPHLPYLSITSKDGVLDSQSTQYLQEICVEDLNMDGNNIFVVLGDAFSSHTLNMCLKKISLKDNPFVGAFSTVYKLLQMGALKHIQMNSQSSNNNEIKEIYGSLLTTKLGIELKSLTSFTRSEAVRSKFRSLVTEKSLIHHESIGESRINYFRILSDSEALTIETNSSLLPNELNVYLSESLEYLDISSLSSFSRVYLNVKCRVHGGQNLLYLDVTNDVLELFEFPIVGFPNLKTFKISYNDLSSFTKSLFDFLPSLESLYVDHCQLSSSFMSQYSDRVLKNLTNLTLLDLSYNSLDILSPKTFSENNKLTTLNINGNRFNDIPFDLTLTPYLNYLDLRKNAIQSISKSNQDKMDRQREVLGTFQLLLEGNTLSCGCANLEFLQWLLQTKVLVDGNRNFTCISNDGFLSFTLAYDDISGFWRFKINKASDYRYGVFIGYCDSDYTFACYSLRNFIENELGLLTFICDRDLSPSAPFAQGIMEAINSSWRVVLVINESFLNQNEWLLFSIRSAIYSISPSNPSRVVILVERRYVNSVPPELWSSDPEDSVIVVNR
ncbi:hypothetical protein Btru_032583 [Bulinus truncatus]|nr:hypothetical protein Btru_032583 [Bulinus truncatus]